MGGRRLSVSGATREQGPAGIRPSSPLLVTVRFFLSFGPRSIARSLGGLPYRTVVGVARGYGRSAHVRLRVLLALALRLIIGRLGQVLVRGGQIGHASLSGLASNALSTGTVR